jgi:hypothetical protein
MSPEYRSWRGMKTRCLNTRDHMYPKYGGRGIGICDRWRDSFEAFLADMGPKPTPRHSIERIDNNGNYEPSNCRWATNTEQSRNRRNTRHITHEGETMCISAWAYKAGISVQTLHTRLRNGMPISAALTHPLGTHFKKRAKK